ncbi:MAG: hypothetical protein ACM3XS_08995 [Bacteroidota bacterium]
MKRTALLAHVLLVLTITSAFAISLETKILFNGLVEIKIPGDFTAMPADMVKIKYPSANRPDLVYTNEGYSVNIGFKHTTSRASQDQLDEYLDFMVKSLKIAYPEGKFLSNGLESVYGRNVGYLEIITTALDTEIYNLIFFTDAEGRLLLGTFNCPASRLPEWQETALEIALSLRVLR